MYWVAGGIAALSVLLEKKARRSELALYVLPRAGDSLWYILVNRHLLPNIRNAEVLNHSLFSLSTCRTTSPLQNVLVDDVFTTVAGSSILRLYGWNNVLLGT